MVSGAAWLLDLSRLVSRLGRGPMTGIDRVERAYLQHVLARPEPVFALVRTALGFVLLDRAGARGVLDRALGHVALGPPDLLGLLTQRHLPQGLRAEADMRRLAIARCLPLRLGRLLRKVLPSGTTYVNVGHANLSQRVMRAAKSVPGAQIAVMVHDTIPLDNPQLCRPGMQAAFAERLAVVSAHADLVLHTARCTRTQTETHLARLGRVPLGIIAPLGVDIAAPPAQAVTAPEPPYFVTLGTIEPRKNIGLLIKVWRELQAGPGPVPHLYVIGNRGWAEPALFDDLDALVAAGTVTLRHQMPDGAVASLLQGAAALLFPSLAEGFGLPPLEAAALGVPVLAGQLPVVVELLHDYPVYLDTADVYAWVKAIQHHAQGQNVDRQSKVPPKWVDHFDLVFGNA